MQLTEIPVGGMCMSEAVEMMGKLTSIGYEANIKSTNGKIVLQLQQTSA